MLREQQIKELINRSKQNRPAFDALLAATRDDDAEMLQELIHVGVLKGDWRRAAIRSRLEELMAAREDVDDGGTFVGLGCGRLRP